MKRVGLFILTNVLVLATIWIVLSLTGAYRYTDARGINLPTLLVFALIVGFAGSFISLAISKWMAKTMMGVQILNPNGQLTADERWLLDSVHRMSRDAGLKKMPEVGIYDSPEVNAFATGPSRNNSLVAVSTGLLNSIDRPGVEGVLGHEVAHVANGDMVTMALVQGVVNTFAVFLSRIIAYAIGMVVPEQARFAVELACILIFQTLLTILGSIVTMWFSRVREFRADAGGAALAGRQNMISALQQLKSHIEAVDHREPAFDTMKISGGKGGLMKLFSSHPDLDVRIERLRQEA